MTDPTRDDGPPREPQRKLYGRRRSHTLRPTRSALMETTAKKIAVPGVVAAPTLETRRQIDPWALFRDIPGGAAEIWLEIGFGGGEHLVHQAKTHPTVGLIGCEHYLDGVGKLVSQVEAEGLRNVRLHAHDARDLIDALPGACLSRVFLLYPDPWPKKRHHKRRFMCAENLDSLARVMTPGAELRVASDIADYCRQALQEAVAHPAFDWTAERAADWREPWEDWPGTRYEAKALAEGRTPCYLTFRRR